MFTGVVQSSRVSYSVPKRVPKQGSREMEGGGGCVEVQSLPYPVKRRCPFLLSTLMVHRGLLLSTDGLLTGAVQGCGSRSCCWTCRGVVRFLFASIDVPLATH